MAARFGQIMHRPSWMHRPKRSGAGPRRMATRERWRRWRDAVYSIRPGNAGLEARARRRIRQAGLPEEGITIEAWKGDLTLRGEAPREVAERYASELRQVKGVNTVFNFIHSPGSTAS